MRIALIVPGGVDRSAEYRIIPALLALIERLARAHDVQVIALSQERTPGDWPLAGAHVHNIGARHTRRRALQTLLGLHRRAPFDLTQAIWSGWCGLIAVGASRLLGIPSLVHVAGGELMDLPAIAFGGSRNWRGRLRERLTLRSATRVTAASAPIIASIAALGARAQRVPLGVDRTAWPDRPPRPRNPGTIARLIHVASLNRVKDQPTLLRALALLGQRGVEFQLDLVGEDTLGGQIEALAAQLGLSSRVVFHGFLPQRQVRPLIEAADLMVISSRHEAGPIVALEAAAVGVPTVGTTVGHLAEWAPHAALAVPVGDAEALAEAVGRVLRDEPLRLRLAQEAQQRAWREDADWTARRFEALYAEVAGTP